MSNNDNRMVAWSDHKMINLNHRERRICVLFVKKGRR